MIWYGDEASKNKVIENRDNPEEKVMWHEETEYKNIFEIPEVLCYLCLEKSDVKTKVTYMFNENVGNVPTETTDE
ncbi:MAG: hypothetical protein BWY61_00324 [Firmicutes bacterium ADurb.Bin354]|nr:MAG: hypothetical protein BWY61_00324 [Firmicutes bacterium ADurb.Bin354]